MNKVLIKQRFAKNLDIYNKNAQIQQHMAQKLLSYLPFKKFDEILEIGCGTGILTDLAINQLEYKNYTANDIVENCEKYIKKINNGIHFIPADIEQGIINNTKKYDLILSNASFQWIENFEKFSLVLISKLNKGGILLFSTFGQKNFNEIAAITGKKLNYYSNQELKDIFKNYNCKVENELISLEFSSPLEVLKHIKNTGVNAIEQQVWTKKTLIDFEQKYNSLCSEQPTLTYEPIYVCVKV